MSFTNPAPGGQIERTDQGVDWGNIRGNIGAVASGVITNVYRGLSGFGTTVIERLTSGQDVYYGLETGGGNPDVSPGESVSPGTPIAPGLGTGGIEVGYWNPSTGRAVGAPEFTGSNATPAGSSFRSRLALGTGTSQNSTLAQLWIQAGGSPRVANTMAAIAMAESGGNIGAQNSSSGAAGLWQILPSAHPQFNVQRLLSDPVYNAQAAVAVYQSQGFSAWSTYTSGAYKSFLSGAASLTPDYGGPNGGIVRPGGDTPTTTPDDTLSEYIALRDMPRTSPPNTKSPFKWWWSSFTDQWDQIA